MVSDQPARTVVKWLRDAGFTARDAKGSHTKWIHPSGASVVVPTGHRSISPGVVRKGHAGDREEQGEDVLHDFKIVVTREGKWWMVRIPEIEGLTQARRLAEAPTMAREYIALDRNIPFDDINIEIASVRMEQPEFAELLEKAQSILARRKQSQDLEAEVQRDTQHYCQWLVTYGVPVRDIAELLDISPQRVSQLANS